MKLKSWCPGEHVAENSIFLQHGTQAEDKYLSAGTLPATCPSIKEIISSSYYNKDLKKIAPLMRSNDFPPALTITLEVSEL